MAEVVAPLVVGIPVLILVGGSRGILFGLFAALIGFLLPGVVLGRLIERRRQAITDGLPDVLDLLIVCLEAGCSLDQSIVRATEELYLAPSPFDHDQTGLFYVTPVDPSRPREEQEQQLQGHCLAAIPLTVAHEAYPGHHLQLYHSNRGGSRLRRIADSTVMCEGWALYCEEMMFEEGYYPDPLTRVFQLKDLLWRACRVVIDVGLHTGRMSFAQAVDFLVEQAMLERVNAEAEVKRYT